MISNIRFIKTKVPTVTEVFELFYFRFYLVFLSLLKFGMKTNKFT